jgi:hypothetical protein
LPICLLLRKTVTDFAIAGLWGCLLSAIILLLGWLASLFGDQKTV